MHIRPYAETDRDVWDAYVHLHPDGTLFHLTAWKDVVETTFRHRSYCLVAVNSGNSSNTTNPSNSINPINPSNTIVGILPVFHVKSLLFGDYLVSVPFGELGGVLADNDTIGLKLLEKAIELANGLKCDYLELRNRRPMEGLETKSLYYNFKREIFPDETSNMNAIPRKARRMIRQGAKFGLTARMGNHLLPDFYDVLSKSFHNLGTPVFSRQWFENLLKAFNDKASLLVVYTKEKIPIAGVLSFGFKNVLMPYYAGSLFEYRNLAPNDFMYWELMCFGAKHNFGCFDYGRSKVDTGSFDFKRHWGFVPQPLAYQYHLVKAEELPNLSPANPKYKKKIEMWQKMPLALSRIIGPPIARFLA